MGDNSPYFYTREEMIDVLKETSMLWCRKVTAYDCKVIEDMFLNYGFDQETIKWLLGFIRERGAVKLDYLYPIADVLKQSDITDRVDVELTLKRSYAKYTNIMQYITGRKDTPAPGQKEKIDEIYEKYNPSEDEIREVGEITSMANRPSLVYFEAVLKNNRKKKR